MLKIILYKKKAEKSFLNIIKKVLFNKKYFIHKFWHFLSKERKENQPSANKMKKRKRKKKRSRLSI